jgi:hypothetical protein
VAVWTSHLDNSFTCLLDLRCDALPTEECFSTAMQKHSQPLSCNSVERADRRLVHLVPYIRGPEDPIKSRSPSSFLLLQCHMTCQRLQDTRHMYATSFGGQTNLTMYLVPRASKPPAPGYRQYGSEACHISRTEQFSFEF